MTEQKKLVLADLLPGDVLVMVGDLRPSNPTRYLDELIMLLTDSDVCHGALYVGPDAQQHDQLIDDALSGVGMRNIANNDNPRDPKYGRWYVRRMQQPDLQPVISAAKSYIGRTEYDKTWLVLLGILLALKDVLPDGELERLALRFLKHAFYVIDQHLAKPGEAHFVCSQYVATAFYDAGSDYALRYKAGTLANNTDVYKALRQQFSTVTSAALGETELAEVSLGLAAQDPALKLMTDVTTELSDTLLNDVAKVLVTILKRAGEPARSSLLKKASAFQTAFVTPACLKDGCTNLDAVGYITLGYGE